MVTLRATLCLAILWPSLNHQAGAQSLIMDNITTNDGLPENSVASMLEDHQGFLWLGTQNGLVRYDGLKMTTFQFDPDDPYSFKPRW